MRNVNWYFDFLSPYAYLQSMALERVDRYATVQARPVLLAGVLNHWGQLGPAEIAPKRKWTYEHCMWLANRDGIAFRLPHAHPFNPLPLLRLALVDQADGTVPRAMLARLFRFVWCDGHTPADGLAWSSLLEECGVADSELATPPVKQALRANTEQAIASGVFGVPTAVVDTDVFWGYESTDMLIERLKGAPLFSTDAYRDAHALPVGATRPGAARPTNLEG